jgi:hypothetical protein
VDVVAAVGAEEQSASVVEPGEGAFDDPAVASEPGAVLGLAAGDDRLDAAVPDEAAVLVVVVAAVGEQRVRPSARPAGATPDRRYAVEQVEQLGDVVAIRGGQRPRERDATAVYEEDASMDVKAPLRSGSGASLGWRRVVGRGGGRDSASGSV